MDRLLGPQSRHEDGEGGEGGEVVESDCTGGGGECEVFGVECEFLIITLFVFGLFLREFGCLDFEIALGEVVG